MATWRKGRVLVVTLALAVVLTGPVAAHADPVNRVFSFGTVSGTVTVHKDKLTYDLNVRDPRPNDRGVYAKFELDFVGFPATQVEPVPSRTTSGGRVRKYKGDLKSNEIQGAALFVCEVRTIKDHCRKAAYIPER